MVKIVASDFCTNSYCTYTFNDFPLLKQVQGVVNWPKTGDGVRAERFLAPIVCPYKVLPSRATSRRRQGLPLQLPRIVNSRIPGS